MAKDLDLSDLIGDDEDQAATGLDLSDLIPAARPETSGAESALRGAQQGATLGFADEIGGGVRALTRKGIEALGLAEPSVQVADEYKALAPAPKAPKSFGEYYAAGRESEREANRRAQADNPLLYGGGEFAGSVLSAAVPGALAAAPGKIGSLAGRAVAAGERLGTIGQAALQGGVAGLGSSEADLTQGDVGEALLDTAKGAAIGGATAGAMQGLIGGVKAAAPLVGRAVRAVRGSTAEGAEGVSQYLAKKALGFERGSTRKLGEKKANDAAAFARENGLITANADEMLRNVEVLKQRAGRNIGEMYQTLDHVGVQPELDTLARRIQNRMEHGAGYADADRQRPMEALQGMIQNLEGQTGQPINVQQLATIKRGMNQYAGWNRPAVSVTPAQEAYREAAHEVSNYIDELIEGAEHQLEGGELAAFRENKRIFGAVSALEDPLINKSARETGNKLIGLTDTIMTSGVAGEVGKSLKEGAIGRAAGQAAVGGAMIAGKRAVERFGPSMGTYALHNFADRLRQDPASFGRYAPALQQAAQRGGNALAVSLFVLQQKDPEFRQTIQENQQ